MQTSAHLNRFVFSALGLALLHPYALNCAQNPPVESNPTVVRGTFRIAGAVVSAASGAPLARAGIHR
jgi:hypothetical protein